MDAGTFKKFMDRMGKLLGGLFVDLAKFTACTLVVASMFDGMEKTWKTYAGFLIVAALCLVAGAIFTRNDNDK
jgi:multimeric flavodoxin WrbA